MKEYHKIQSLFKRDQTVKSKPLILGEFVHAEFEYLKDNQWEFSEKLDGMNVRIMLDENGLRFGGKTVLAQMPKQLLKNLYLMFDEKELRDFFPENVCLYGEGVGPKIQKNGEKYSNEQTFVLFDIKIGNFWLKREDVEDIAQKLNIQFAPIIGKGNLNEMIDLCKKGFNSKFGDFLAEGIVARPFIDLFSRNGGRIITKLKIKDFKNV